MSAFLFRSSSESIRALTDLELEDRRVGLEDFLKDIKWESLSQCTFDFDQAYGRRATLAMVKEEIRLRAEGKGSEPLRTAVVPGYNP